MAQIKRPVNSTGRFCVRAEAAHRSCAAAGQGPSHECRNHLLSL